MGTEGLELRQCRDGIEPGGEVADFRFRRIALTGEREPTPRTLSMVPTALTPLPDLLLLVHLPSKGLPLLTRLFAPVSEKLKITGPNYLHA